MRTIKQILEAFKKDLRIGYQAQKNIVDISEHYIHELSEADLKGGGVDYSLEEQDTGLKWIDGKTIYQKSYRYQMSGVSGSIDITDLQVDTAWIYDGFYDIGASNLSLNEWQTASYKTYAHINTDTTPPVIDLNCMWSNAVAYVTIRYTK